MYQYKIKNLHKKYSYICKTRLDRSCLNAAFSFSHLEPLLEDSSELRLSATVFSGNYFQPINAQGHVPFLRVARVYSPVTTELQGLWTLTPNEHL